jgi:hypothetical protein
MIDKTIMAKYTLRRNKMNKTRKRLKKLLFLLISSTFSSCFTSPHTENDVMEYVINNIYNSPCVIEKTGKNKWTVFFKNVPNLKFNVRSIGGMRTPSGLLPSGNYHLETDYFHICQEYYIKKYYEEKNYNLVEDVTNVRIFVNGNNEKGSLYLIFSIITVIVAENNIDKTINEIIDFVAFIKKQENNPHIIIECKYINNNKINNYRFDTSKDNIDEIEPSIKKLINSEL